MKDLFFTLVSDGSSDSLLNCHLSWLIRQHVAQRVAVQSRWADLRAVSPKPSSLAEKIVRAVDLYPCDILFVHRDAERGDPAPRFTEIADAVRDAAIGPPVVAVVPIRMTEAWLLFHEQAVRRAAGNPNGRCPLRIPDPDAEQVADPKNLLHEALRSASELSGRRLRGFRLGEAVHRVAEYIDDFGPLRALSSFRKLERDLVSVLDGGGWTCAKERTG